MRLADDRMVTAVFRDSAAPGVTLLEPAGTGPRRGVIALAASASDNVGVAGVEFRVRDELIGSRDTVAPYGTTFDTASRPDGSAEVKATAFDAAGNATTQSRTITIDNTAPGLTVTGPDGATFGPGTTQSWTIGATDATTAPATVQCSVVPAGSGPELRRVQRTGIAFGVEQARGRLHPERESDGRRREHDRDDADVRDRRDFARHVDHRRTRRRLVVNGDDRDVHLRVRRVRLDLQVPGVPRGADARGVRPLHGRDDP